MKSTTKMEVRILGGVASACYVFALATCAVATYALAALSLVAYGDIGLSSYPIASRFQIVGVEARIY
jgi:hypothetical protein